MENDLYNRNVGSIQTKFELLLHSKMELVSLYIETLTYITLEIFYKRPVVKCCHFSPTIIIYVGYHGLGNAIGIALPMVVQ